MASSLTPEKPIFLTAHHGLAISFDCSDVLQRLDVARTSGAANTGPLGRNETGSEPVHTPPGLPTELMIS